MRREGGKNTGLIENYIIYFQSIGRSSNKLDSMNPNYLWLPAYYNPLNYIPESPTLDTILPTQHHQPDYDQLLEKYTQLQHQHDNLLEQYTKIVNERDSERKKGKRRTQNQLNKCFHCPYGPCRKEYASELALNLHIRIKHNGGCKKDRDRVARLILRAQMSGKQRPKISIELPPGYIQTNRIRLLLLESEEQSPPEVKQE